MPFKYLVLDVLRVGVLLSPVAAILATARSDDNAIALLLLWVPAYFRGIGYDIVRHAWGTEASIYFSALLFCQTAPYVLFDDRTMVLWGIVLGFEVAYMVLSGIKSPLQVYLDEWSHLAHDNATMSYPLVPTAAAAKGKGKGNDADALTTRNVLYLASVFLVGNGLRVVFVYLYARGSIDAVYNDEGTILLWSYAAQMVITTLMMARLKAIYRRAAPEHNNSYFLSVGGLLYLYMYLQLAVVWIAVDWQLVLLTLAQVVALLVVDSVVQYRMLRANLTKVEFLFVLVAKWFELWVEMCISEPMAYVAMIVLTGTLSWISLDTWFTTTIYFPPLIQEFACPLADLIDNYVSLLFIYLNSERAYSLYLTSFAGILSRLRLSLYTLLVTAYPVVNSGCYGASVSVAPLSADNVWALPFVLLPWVVTLFVLLQPFLEIRNITSKPGFWLVSFLLCILSLVVVQLTGDVEVSFFALLVDGTQFHRSYTVEGIIGIGLQFAQAMVCLAMYRHRRAALKEDEEDEGGFTHTHTHTGTAPLGLPPAKQKPSLVYRATAAVWHPVDNVVDSVLSTGTVFLVGAVALVVVGVLAKLNPVEFIHIGRATPSDNLPAWLVLDPIDSVLQVAGSIIEMVTEEFEPLVDGFAVGAAVLAEIGQNCGGACATVLDSLEDLVDDLVNVIDEGVTLALTEAAPLIESAIRGLFNELDLLPGLADEFIAAFDEMAGLNVLEDFHLVNLGALQLIDLRFPSWLLYILGGLVGVIVLLWLASFAYPKKLEVYIHVCNAFVVTSMLGVGVWIAKLYAKIIEWGLALSVQFNESVWVYGLALLCLLLSMLFFYLENNNNGNDTTSTRRSHTAAPVPTLRPESESPQYSRRTRERRWLRDSTADEVDQLLMFGSHAPKMPS